MDERNNVQQADIEDTIPEYSSEEIQDTRNVEQDIVTPNNDESTEESVARDEDEAAQTSLSEKVSEPFISIQYNHKNRNFTKEEAIKYLQKGMHTESLRAKLEYLAAKQGTDVNSLVEKIVSAPEDAYRKHLENMYGTNSPDVEIGMQIYKEKQSSEYKKIMSESARDSAIREKYDDINSRLADEYMTLRTEMPDAPEYCDLPDSVIIEAAEGKRDLFSAYLCHLYKEKRKIELAEKAQIAASQASSGRMSVDNGNDMTSSDKNFLLGLWSK